MEMHNQYRCLGTVLVTSPGNIMSKGDDPMVLNASKSDGHYHGLTGATILSRRLFMVALIAAAVLGVKQPAAYADFDPPGSDTFCIQNAFTNGLCQLSPTWVSVAFVLPELAGHFGFVGGGGHFAMGTDGARLTGDIFAGGTQFSAAVDMSGRVAPPTSPILDGYIRPECWIDTSSWIGFTEISGELVGLPGSPFAGATYAITGTSEAQLGIGANTHNIFMGLFARINFELIDPGAHPDLPVGPFAGEISVEIREPGVDLSGVRQECFAPAEPDLTGTWTGTIDCVGFDAEVSPAATPVEDFFSTAVLEIGRSTNELDVGDQYSVRLTRRSGDGQSFCAYAPNNPGSTTGGQGVLVEPQRQATRVHFRFEGETLKARELIADGLHGTQTCKWSFTRASTTPPTVADACSPSWCYTNPSIEQCDDNAVCGQGPSFEDWDYTCTCADGYIGDASEGYCAPAP